MSFWEGQCLDAVVRISLALQRTAKLSSKVAVLISIPPVNEWQFLLLHVLASILCLQCSASVSPFVKYRDD